MRFQIIWQKKHAKKHAVIFEDQKVVQMADGSFLTSTILMLKTKFYYIYNIYIIYIVIIILF